MYMNFVFDWILWNRSCVKCEIMRCVILRMFTCVYESLELNGKHSITVTWLGFGE